MHMRMHVHVHVHVHMHVLHAFFRVHVLACLGPV